MYNLYSIDSVHHIVVPNYKYYLLDAKNVVRYLVVFAFSVLLGMRSM